jgi:hypothetical protein
MRKVPFRSAAISGEVTEAAGDAPPRPCGADAAGGACAKATWPAQIVIAARIAALPLFMSAS